MDNFIAGDYVQRKFDDEWVEGFMVLDIEMTPGFVPVRDCIYVEKDGEVFATPPARLRLSPDLQEAIEKKEGIKMSKDTAIHERRKNLVEIACEFMPLISKHEVKEVVITIAGAGNDPDDLLVTLFFDRTDLNNWRVKYKYRKLDSMSEDWIQLGRFSLQTTYEFVEDDS